MFGSCQRKAGVDVEVDLSRPRPRHEVCAWIRDSTFPAEKVALPLMPEPRSFLPSFWTNSHELYFRGILTLLSSPLLPLYRTTTPPPNTCDPTYHSLRPSPPRRLSLENCRSCHSFNIGFSWASSFVLLRINPPASGAVQHSFPPTFVHTLRV